jgi:hypothetical protein
MKRIIKEFELSRIAAVDRPCQQGAVVTILKRAPSNGVSKYKKALPIDTVGWLAKQFLAFPMTFDNDDGPDDFDTAFAENVENQLKSELGSELYSYTSALREAIAGILACSDLTPDDKRSKIKESVTQFVTSLQERFPMIAEDLEKVVEKAYLTGLRKRFLIAKISLLSWMVKQKGFFFQKHGLIPQDERLWTRV